MPRTTTIECPGCPPLRALTFDSLGLIKVVESRGGRAIPQVVERWGDPDASKCVVTASIDDRKQDPLLAVARKNGVIEVLNPLSGGVNAVVSNDGDAAVQPKDDYVVGLHLFRRERLSGHRSCNVLSCTTKGNTSFISVDINKSSSDSVSAKTLRTWNVCGSGNIFCSKVDASENFAVFGGKRVEVNLWDLEKCVKFWAAKPPPKNNLGIFTPTWFTCTTFMSNDDHRKFVAGTDSHLVHLYDISAQRRPILSLNFRETAIKAIAEDQDGHTIYVGNGSGDLGSFDIRTGKLLGCFLGKCSGSIRSIARHPYLPVLASCGLDSYLRLWDVETRQLLSATFLKQHLATVVFDSNFTDKDQEQVAVDAKDASEIPSEDVVGASPAKRKKPSKEKEEGRKKASKVKGESKMEGSKKLRSKKKSRKAEPDC